MVWTVIFACAFSAVCDLGDNEYVFPIPNKTESECLMAGEFTRSLMGWDKRDVTVRCEQAEIGQKFYNIRPRSR